MKKISLLLLVLLSTLILSGCKDTEDVEEKTMYTVTFDTDGGSAIAAVEVEEGTVVVIPSAPTKDGYTFMYWYTTDDTTEYDFATVVNADITLHAYWQEIVVGVTDEDRILEDIAQYESEMFINENLIYMPRKGKVNRSSMRYSVDSQYISKEGVILPIPLDETVTEGELTVTFTLNDTVVEKVYAIPLNYIEEVVIDHSVSLPFENLTTEYDVEDGNVDMYYEEDGAVPYIKVVDFFDLLEGFIDPDVDFTIDTTDGVLTISYQYYDEDYDETYDMVLTVDSVENTVVVNDPGFYWAYVYSTETNYGRHIEYDIDNPDSSFEEGDDVVYDLDDYNMDIVTYDGEVLLPYYVANQLLAGLSYYNVYYNTDGLFGIYSLPEDGSRELRTIRRSSMNGEDIPVDLLIHTFNMLAFDLDNLYGLQDIMDVDTYYDLLYDNKDSLLVTDPEDFDYAIRDLLLKEIDEPHTSYGYHSYFNSILFDGPETNSLSYYGPRFVNWYYDGLVAVDGVIEEKWGAPESGWAAASPSRPYYWFLDDTSVVLILDDFYTADIDESSAFDLSFVEGILDVDDASGIVPTITEGNKFFYYNNSTDKENVLEMLVKGVSSSYVDTYEDALIAAGFTYVYEETINQDKINGYYTISVATEDVDNPTIDFMVQVRYDEEYQLFYVGVVDSVPVDFTSNWPLIVNVEETVNSDSAVYVEMMMDQIMEEAPDLENIILDLSWNTGGNIGALYRIVGFITDDPFRVSSIDGDTNGYSSYYVIIDDGIPSYAYLNWSLLITPVTFSAANEMATIFMENDLGPIMGVTSGGGACSITPVLLPNGTAFTMSSNNIGAYRTGSGTEADPYVYHNTEFGIEPDYPIDIDMIYDVDTLLGIINAE